MDAWQESLKSSGLGRYNQDLNMCNISRKPNSLNCSLVGGPILWPGKGPQRGGLKMDLNFGSNLGPTTVVGPLLRSFLGSAFRHPSGAILFHEMWGLDNPLCSKRKLSKFQYGIAKSCQSVSRLASTPSSKIAPMDCNQDLFPGPSTLSITIQRRIQLGGKCTVQLSQRAADGYVDCYP